MLAPATQIWLTRHDSHICASIYVCVCSGHNCIALSVARICASACSNSIGIARCSSDYVSHISVATRTAPPKPHTRTQNGVLITPKEFPWRVSRGAIYGFRRACAILLYINTRARVWLVHFGARARHRQATADRSQRETAHNDHGRMWRQTQHKKTHESTSTRACH